MGNTHPAPQRQPWRIFSTRVTPSGLYARQKWLGEEQTPSWRQDFDQTVAGLRHGQQASGLWQDSPLATIHHLFGLHLTVRAADPDIDRALDALLKHAENLTPAADDTRITRKELAGLPFTSARWGDLLPPAVLFLSAIFGRASDPQVIALYSRIASDLSASGPGAAALSKVHNCFRALVVHPDDAGHETTHNVVAWYARRQTSDGDWGAEIPFYQALNALAHLDTAAAEKQCQAGFDSLPARQNTDGSWGREQREWHTFLTLHALRNKGRLSLP
jgi:hypothetical protein